jgi:methyl-accepting chemotaxis protein
MKKSLGSEFDRFNNIIQKVRKGGQVESAGYFLQDDRGKLAQEKYMVMSPIPGTTYGILAITHLDEFTREISRLSKRANKITLATRNIVLIILGATLLLIFMVVMAYGQSLSGRIQSLTDLAEQISIGNLDTQIEVKTKDEIGILADAISRMQESIRLSMERLRRRR